MAIDSVIFNIESLLQVLKDNSTGKQKENVYNKVKQMDFLCFIFIYSDIVNAMNELYRCFMSRRFN